jgi:AcrR family transcriptional regulator
MSKGQRTREAILDHAVILFNQKGYTGVSLADVMQATRLQKGGIYNHFASKEMLAVEAFEHGFQRTARALFHSLASARQPIERLNGFVRFFQDYYANPPLTGGCILLNTAVDADDSNPILKERAQRAMQSWHDLLVRTISRGIAQGQVRANVDPDDFATVMISTLEGAIMMSKLYDSPRHIEAAVAHLLNYIARHVQAE